MDPCRSGAARVPPPAFRPNTTTNSPAGGLPSSAKLHLSSRAAVAASQRHSDQSEVTLSHLIRIIEQLKGKDKVISQLERELGHPAVQQQQLAAGPVSMATEVTRHAPSSPGQPSSSSSSNKKMMEPPSISPHTLLSGLQQVFQRLHGTGMASFPLGGEEKGASGVESFAGLEAEILGLHNRAESLYLDRQLLLDKIKEVEVRNKQLVEKNKRFLEKNVTVTAHNRTLQDGSHTLLQQNKKLQDEAEECRRRQCDLARELQRIREHNLELEAQAAEVASLRKQITDQTSSITLLRQACTDKDRRIELIQHRKKRRRLIRSQEKCLGVKETFYGYDDDDNDNSIDSETSQSSVSVSTISEEDACDELSREELERSHRQMLREHLQLERSHALLQAHTGASQDPYRELQTRSQLQADLFSAQCRTELLEKEIRGLHAKQQRRGSGVGVEGMVPDCQDALALLKERDDLLAARHGLQMKLEQADSECVRLRQELRKAEERAEDLEFRILELEENPSPPCQGHDLCQGHEPCQGHNHSQGPDLCQGLYHSRGDDDDDSRDSHHGSDLQHRHQGDEGRGVKVTDGVKEEVAECFTSTVAPSVEAGGRQPEQLSAPEEEEEEEEEEESGSMEFDRLRRELKRSLDRQGVKAEAVMKDLGGLKDLEQKVTSMERMAMEMQHKVISLQQERDSLEERLMRGAPLSLNAEVERRQNLELKEEVGRLSAAKEDSSAENSRLARQLQDSQHLCISLQEQLKEFLEPSAPLSICGQSILGPRRGEGTGQKTPPLFSNKRIQTERSADGSKRRDIKRPRSRSRESREQRAEVEALTQKVKSLQSQVKKLEAENLELAERNNRNSSSTNDSSSDDDDPSLTSLRHKPPHKVQTLERQLRVLQSENLRLSDQLGGYSTEGGGAGLDSNEVIERVVELEDRCAELQDGLREAEGQERQSRDRLRVAERTINELELSEAHYRERCEDMARMDREARRQLHSLQSTGRELKEIILDKEVLEQTLKDKVEFLEKVEEQSTHRITELESLERSLREQLEARDRADPSQQALQQLKERLGAAEQQIESLQERNNELEENEEILRENWRRVADEDANRLKCLEEKVKMLEVLNQDLKTKVLEAQDFVVINTGPSVGSLAEELSASRTSLARPLSDSPVSNASDDDLSGEETSSARSLKRQLSLLEEEKNGKIAGLQEKLADMKENEIKLSETVAEMEMTERELRAKLALYESSEVTVEKMLKYQDRIDELRTSQESLLDQLETMETQEETLQERLEETDRRLKGKIVTLEVELKNLKHKELKGNARIRELEKHEEELTEKTQKQAEKENALYVRISGLMDQVKDAKAKVAEQEKKLAEKDERCRKVASLEAKFLQIEGAYREKVTALEASLNEAHSSLKEEEKSQRETRESMDLALQSRDKEHAQRVFILQEMLDQKEKGLNGRIASLEGSLAERDRAVCQQDKLIHDKDERIAQLQEEIGVKQATIGELESSGLSKESDLEKNLSLRDQRIGELEKDLSDRDAKIGCLEQNLSEKESCVSALEQDLSEKKLRVSAFETEVCELQKTVSEKEKLVAELESSVSEKAECISELERDLDLKQCRIAEAERDVNESEVLRNNLVEKDKRIHKLENELGEKASIISNLQNELGASKLHVNQLEKDVNDKNVQITEKEKELSEKVSQVSELENDSLEKEEELQKMFEDLDEKEHIISNLETELDDKVSHVTHLETVVGDRDRQIKELEMIDGDLSHRLDEAKEDLANRDRHISAMGQQIAHLTSVVSDLEKKAREKEARIATLEVERKDQDSAVCEKMSKLQSAIDGEQKSASSKLSALEEELCTVREQFSETRGKCQEHCEQLAAVSKELAEEKSSAQSLKLSAESQSEEQEQKVCELTAKVTDLETRLSEQEEESHTKTSVRESEFQQACSALDAQCQSLRAELAEKGRVIEKLESTKNELLSKIELLKDREKEAAKRLTEVESDLGTIFAQKDQEMREAASIWEKKVSDAEQEKETAVEKACSLEADLLSSRQKMLQKLEETSQLEAKLAEARRETERVQGALRELQRQEEEGREVEVQQEVILKTRVSQVEAQLQEHSAQQENLSQQKQQLEAELTTSQQSFLRQKQTLEEELVRVQSQLKNSHALNSNLQDKVTQLTSHTATLKQEVKELQQLVHDLEVNQNQERDIHSVLEQERARLQDLETEIGDLKDQRQSAAIRAEQLQRELDQSKETASKLQSHVETLSQAEEALKAQIAAEQNSRLEADRKLTEEVATREEKAALLVKENEEKDEEMDKLKVELLLLKQELQTQQSLSVESKGQELEHFKEKEESFQKKEAALQERITSMESQIAKHQENHCQMCQKLHVLERREKELLEQMTDIEQSVIVPLETENAELKDAVTALVQQTEALNVQIDKQEEQTREDSAELEVLRKTVNDLQVSRTETQSKLHSLTQELAQKTSEKEQLCAKVADLDAVKHDFATQLQSKEKDLSKADRKQSSDSMNHQETQTDPHPQVSEEEWRNLQQKLTVLQDAESTFMSRIIDLEVREQQLCEELDRLRTEKGKQQQSSLEGTSSPSEIPDSRDAGVDTEDLQEPNTAKVPELFARVQELESSNQRLSLSLDQASASETDRRQLTEKVHLLEQSEDRLMERVMELEEREVMLRTQLERSRHRANAADKLEEEVALLLQQEDDWKDQVAGLTAQNSALDDKLQALQQEDQDQVAGLAAQKSALADKLQALQSQFGDEVSKGQDLAFRLEADQRQLGEARRELTLARAKLAAVRSEYEEKLSALEESEKSLGREVQVLREEMEDLCERYKELELENSSLKHQQTRSQSLQQAGAVSRGPVLQASQAQTLQATQAPGLQAGPLSSSKSSPSSTSTSRDSQSPPTHQVCSTLTLQMVPSTTSAAQKSAHSPNHSVNRITQLKKTNPSLSRSENAGVSSSFNTQGSSDSPKERNASDSGSSGSAKAPGVKVLTLHDALEENAALKAQIHQLQSRSVSLSAPAFLPSDRKTDERLGEVAGLQSEVCRLQSRVADLERSLQEAEGAVQEVVTVVRTRSVHTLEQKIETIQHTIHTQSPGWSLHQELLELLTSQADLQKQVSHLMETEHNLRMALKQMEDDLARARSGSGVSARRLDTDRRLSLQSRLSRFGGGISSTKAQGDPVVRRQVDSSQRTKEQWLERQVADLQLAKTNLERRLHEAERRLAFRPRSTSAARDELLFRIQQLEEEQGQWRKKVEDLQALNSHYLKEKLELAGERDSLEHRLQTQSPSLSKEVSQLFAGGRREEPLGSSGSVSEGEAGSPGGEEEGGEGDTMRDKPEDVLQKRIKELENLESYLRQQLSEVESDRDQLHEIARRDKATIHEQNVRLREMLLTERNLRSQVTGLEDSERSLYNRCGELDDRVSRLEDRVHELEVHERRLKELVRRLKLDEEVWLSKSGDLTASMEHLSSSELSLRKTVQDLQLENGRLSDRAEYLDVRVKELESLETTLVQRLRNYENVESSLQNRLQHTENSEVAAHSKASELDVLNMDLSSRLQRAVEENAVLSQHVAQQQGQIHNMDRKLSAASDAQVGLSQTVDSLQKNEAVLQKKVREYQLHDIDAQARVRELEQTEEILKDKVNQLQRSENRLKSRLDEFENISSQMLENLPLAQRQQLPQQLDECQQRVLTLQRQLEAAHQQLANQPSAPSSADQSEAAIVKVSAATLQELRGKAAILEETEFQLSESEKVNAQLSDNVLQLRQGKGSCGHEVELEVLKRRLRSYQDTIQKLKPHLSEGQVPSLRASDTGQGPESDNLPARALQCLESERVLHSVRSLTQPAGLSPTQDMIVQAHSGPLQAGRAQAVTHPAPSPPAREQGHWATVEHRGGDREGEPRGASPSIPPHPSSTTAAASSAQEELVMGLSLPSESERSGLHSQNDTDSEQSGCIHPHLLAASAATTQLGAAPSTASTPGVVPSARGGAGVKRGGPAQIHPPVPTSSTTTTLPPALSSQQQRGRTASGFVTDDSFYLPSSAGVSETEDERDGVPPPPLPSSAPPGLSQPSPAPATLRGSDHKTFASSLTLSGQKGGEGEGGQRSRSRSQGSEGATLQTTSVVGLSIRQRIAQIEQQLKENPSRGADSRAEEEDMFTWKVKATENARLLGSAEREGKQLKEDLPPAARRREKINKLEKDLEEKRRYIYIFEKWILDAEEVLKNKNKKNDRDLVQQLQTEVKHLKQDLGNAGYRKDDIFTDPAALKTEVDRRERELVAKRSEVESLSVEVQRWQQEAVSVEAMRKNALDSLRLLETEVTALQDADVQLKSIKDDYNTLRGQYDEVNIQRNKAVAAVHVMRAKISRLSQKCQEKDELLRRLSEELRSGRGRSGSLLEELGHLEVVAGGEEYNRPLSPLDLITGSATTDTERLLSERNPQASTFTFPRWSSTTSLHDPHDLSPADQSTAGRPRSAEPSRRGQHSGRKVSVGDGGAGLRGDNSNLCVAILDYLPDAATSRSGQRHLELALKEGDHVEVKGPVDRHGYCEAEVGGRSGLVPASHLYPLTSSAAAYRPSPHRHSAQKKGGMDSSEQIVQMFKELQDPGLLSGLPHSQSSALSHKAQQARHAVTATQTRNRPATAKNSAVPEAPTNLHIKEASGNSLLLAWQPPPLDAQGSSNGCKVVGYRIYLNGRVCQQPHNPRLSQTRVEGVRGDGRPQQLAVQTLATRGQASARTELVYQTGSASRRREDEDGEGDTDLSSILNSIHYKTGKKRTVVGLYDYDPQTQSPGDYPACELAFSAGDVMLVYGEERQDGFFHGERNGKRGLVPACFVETVNQDSKPTQKPGTANGNTSPRS